MRSLAPLTKSSNNTHNRRGHGVWGSFWNEPRSLQLRKLIFRIHLVCGLAVGLAFTIMGLSGSALVYRDQLDAALNPRLTSASSVYVYGSGMAEQMLTSAQTAHPNWHMLLLDCSGQHSWAFYQSPTGWTQQSRIRIEYFDPGTGRFLGERGMRHGALNWLMQLHTNLLAGPQGTFILGLVALLLLLMTSTGIFLWWPGVRRWRASLRMRGGTHWPRKIWDIHNVVGFFSSLSLSLQAMTAASLAIPTVVMPFLLIGGNRTGAEIHRFDDPPPTHDLKKTGAPFTLDDAISVGKSRYPGMQLESVTFPTNPDDSLLVTLGNSHFESRGTQARVAIDPQDGTLLSDIDTISGSNSLKLYALIGPWHYGRIAGNLSKIVWAILGLCPGALFITGILIWWRSTASKQVRSRLTTQTGRS